MMADTKFLQSLINFDKDGMTQSTVDQLQVCVLLYMCTCVCVCLFVCVFFCLCSGMHVCVLLYVSVYVRVCFVRRGEYVCMYFCGFRCVVGDYLLVHAFMHSILYSVVLFSTSK